MHITYVMDCKSEQLFLNLEFLLEFHPVKMSWLYSIIFNCLCRIV
ncbi:hypothetical protein THF5H11_20169 [Vibrio jasicida]|nr:hypothetical protein THF5H11_20169 [Vibrio jasicida]